MPDPGTQLQLRLFERLDGYRGVPPERAVWRELLAVAIQHPAYLVGTGRVSSEAVHHVGVQMFMHADDAGIVGVPKGDGRIYGISNAQLAGESGMNERTTRRALRVIELLAIARGVTAADAARDPRLVVSRRRGRIWRMHVDGLDWRQPRARLAQRTRLPAPAPAAAPPELPLAPQVAALGAAATEKQISGIRSMMAELGVAGMVPGLGPRVRAWCPVSDPRVRAWCPVSVWPPAAGWPSVLAGSCWRVTYTSGIDFGGVVDDLRAAVVLGVRQLYDGAAEIRPTAAFYALVAPWRRYD